METNGVICRDTSLPIHSELTHSLGIAQTSHVTPAVSSLAKSRSRSRLIWGMGGTILSVVGFLAMILFEQYNGMLSELRTDLKHFNETSSDYVKKDNFQRFKDQFRERYKEFQALLATRTQLEHELHVSEKAREEMTHELQKMRERLAFLEGRHTTPPPADAGKTAEK